MFIQDCYIHELSIGVALTLLVCFGLTFCLYTLGNNFISDSCFALFSLVDLSVVKFWQNYRIQNNFFIINIKIVYPSRWHFSLKLENTFDTLQQQTKGKKEKAKKFTS